MVVSEQNVTGLDWIGLHSESVWVRVQVDDVLEAHRLSLVGPEAVSAVIFEHPGFVLCPVEDPSGGSNGSNEDGSGSNGGCSGSNGSNAPSKPQTLGAFVSAELMGDDSSSCSSEGSSGEQQ